MMNYIRKEISYYNIPEIRIIRTHNSERTLNQILNQQSLEQLSIYFNKHCQTKSKHPTTPSKLIYLN